MEMYMKTVLVFNFDRYYPNGGADDLRHVLRIEGDFNPQVVLDTLRPLDGDYVNVVILEDGSVAQESLYWVVEREPSEEALLRRDVVVHEDAPRYSGDLLRWVGLRPRDY
jgi:hypothetical protein